MYDPAPIPPRRGASSSAARRKNDTRISTINLIWEGDALTMQQHQWGRLTLFARKNVSTIGRRVGTGAPCPWDMSCWQDVPERGEMIVTADVREGFQPGVVLIPPGLRGVAAARPPGGAAGRRELAFVGYVGTRLLQLTQGKTAMKPRRRKRPTAQGNTVVLETSTTTIFSSDLLTPEEERELLANFWDCKTELVKQLIRQNQRLRQHKPPMNEPWPMAQFIRDYCDDAMRDCRDVRRLHDSYIHYKHRLASANIPFR